MNSDFILEREKKKLTFKGKDYPSLTDTQMDVLELLKQDWDAGGSGLYETFLVEKAKKDSTARIKDIFKSMKSWKSVINKVPKYPRLYRLNMRKSPYSKAKTPYMLLLKFLNEKIVLHKKMFPKVKVKGLFRREKLPNGKFKNVLETENTHKKEGDRFLGLEKEFELRHGKTAKGIEFALSKKESERFNSECKLDLFAWPELQKALRTDIYYLESLKLRITTADLNQRFIQFPTDLLQWKR